jgi:anti-sigma B factor antagonist
VEGEERAIERGPLTLRVRGEGERGLRLEIRGDLDLSNAEALEVELRRAVETDAERIVVDLSGLDYVDSTGMAVLTRIKTEYGTDRFTLVRAPEQVQRVLALAGLEQALPFVDANAEETDGP